MPWLFLLGWGFFQGIPGASAPLPAAAPAAVRPADAVSPTIQGSRDQAGKPGLLERHPKMATAAIFTAVPMATTLLGMQMWEWGDTTHFKAGSDGGFERHNTHGGADKLGHAWSFYFGTRLFTSYFDAVYPRDHIRAALWGAALSWAASVAVEIGDGFASVYGFSYTDLMANTLGVALGLAQDLWPAVDDLLDFSVHILFSPGFMNPDNPNHFDFATDYSGSLFTLHLRLGGLGLFSRRNPLRYLRLDTGYFARCYEVMDGCSRESLGTDRFETRSLYFGVSFDLARMIREHGSRNEWLQFFGTATRYYNVQGFFQTGFNVDLNHGGAVNLGTATDSQLR